MFHTNTTDQFYDNTSFSAEENNLLKSNFLSFGKILSIAINLLKKRISNLFLPILIWQLILLIGFMFVEYILFLGISNSIPSGSSIYIPSFKDVINTDSYTITVRFGETIANLLALPFVAGFMSLMVLVLVVFGLLSNWIQFKSITMLNDSQIKLFDGNNFIKRFWGLVLFFTLEIIIFQIISSIFETKESQSTNILIAILSLVIGIIIGYLDTIAKYISYIYLIEKNDFWSSFLTMLKNTKMFLIIDFLRHIFFALISFGVILMYFMTFVGFSFGLFLLISGIDSNNVASLIFYLLIVGLLIFATVVFAVTLSWLAETFLYVSYYNLRMLDYDNLNNKTERTENLSDSKTSNTNQNDIQTLEEKLMQSSEIKSEIVDPN